jgi:hypothetical protein
MEREYHNVGRADVALRLLAAAAALILAATILEADAEWTFVAMLVVMPLFVYLLLTAAVREDPLYVLWDVDTRQPRGHRWSGHHGERGGHFE